ncbi:hypothetical protein [Candidatus Poriferisocius sp.]|uniref:hypothetical protein n=1 Tax=Candidatus Poriferisocius sp. TaxID=3101276 RepID=UPI003B011D00
MPVSARGERGLVTLEWMLIVSAIAGLAAVSVLTVQQVLDTATDLPADPDTLIVDAEITAAKLAAEATQAMRDNPSGYPALDSAFSDRCANIATTRNSSVIEGTPKWTPPEPGPTVEPAICKLTRHAS